MSKKNRVVEPVEMQDGLSIHQGVRVVEGTRTFNQFIVRGDECIPDSMIYERDQRDGYMLGVARGILLEIATGRSLNIQHPSRYGLEVEAILRQKIVKLS